MKKFYKFFEDDDNFTVDEGKGVVKIFIKTDHQYEEEIRTIELSLNKVIEEKREP